MLKWDKIIYGKESRKSTYLISTGIEQSKTKHDFPLDSLHKQMGNVWQCRAYTYVHTPSTCFALSSTQKLWNVTSWCMLVRSALLSLVSVVLHRSLWVCTKPPARALPNKRKAWSPCQYICSLASPHLVAANLRFPWMVLFSNTSDHLFLPPPPLSSPYPSL